MVQSKLKSSKAVSSLREKKESRAKGPLRPQKKKALNMKQQTKHKLGKAIHNNIERIMANRVEEYSNISSTRTKLEIVKPPVRNPLLDKGKKNKRREPKDGTHSVLLDAAKAAEKPVPVI